MSRLPLHNLFRRGLFLLVGLLLLLPLAGVRAPAVGAVGVWANAAPAYTITDLGVLGTDQLSYATDINDAGQVIGNSGNPYTVTHPFLWQNGVLTDLAPGRAGAAAKINASGQIAGTNGGHAVVWQAGTSTELPRAATDSTEAYGLNDSGQVVGTLVPAGKVNHAVRWQNGVLQEIGTPPDFMTSAAVAVNNSGQVVMTAAKRDGALNSFLLSPTGTLTNLGSLGGTIVEAYRINTAGQVVGMSANDLDFRPFLYTAGQMHDLGTLGGPDGRAMGINDRGQIVGDARTSNPAQPRHAFLWQNGVMLDLNSLIPANTGWILTEATAINFSGAIVGSGIIKQQRHAYLLQPTGVPLPPPTAPPLPAGTAPQCFSATGKCMRSLFADYWQAHGGLAINGFPISDEFVEVQADGNAYTVQYFERVRMEYHPEAFNPAYVVQLGQFGRAIHPANSAVPQRPEMTYYDQTGHNVPPDFQAYWDAHGGLVQFGYPISEVFKETLENGQQYEVQYFERARFERHPENAAPYDILLGQFGRRILGAR